MTMKNAVSKFGIRTAVVLALMAMVALAALLAVGSPVSAQNSDDGDEIWSATMTVGSHPSLGIKGYNNPAGTTNDYGSLSDADLPSAADGGQSSYDVIVLLDSAAPSGTLIFGTYQDQFLDPELEAMTLHIGGRTFKFADATYAFETATSTHSYSWSLSPRFGWATGQTVAVSITALPIVVVEPPRGRTGVQYGGNDNAAEATAEFIFTRTGSTDEALSFTFLHHQSGQTATRTFKAGEASFSNFHWAIDVDASNNPVCIITWQVQPGDGYVPGYGFTGVGAFVTVIGPGTTCMGGI